MEGIKSTISIGKETVWGTAVEPTLTIPIYPSSGIQLNQEIVGIEGIKGTPPKNRGFALGKRVYEGGYEMPLYANASGYFLVSALGSCQTTNLGNNVYKHTITESVSKKSLTVEQSIAGEMTKRFSGYQVGKFTISGKSGELLMMSFEGKAKTQVNANPITPVFTTEKPFTFKDVYEISFGGQNFNVKTEDFEIEYDNSLEYFHGLGSYEANKPYVQQSTLTGKATLYVDSITKQYFDDIIDNVEREVVIDIRGNTIVGNNIYRLKITLSKCQITKFETPLDTDYSAINLEFEAREDATNGLIVVELTNTTSGY